LKGLGKPEDSSDALSGVARFLVVALLTVLVTGCSSSGGAADGHYVNYRWGSSQKSCAGGQCSYGANSVPFTTTLRCDTAPSLSWDATGWIHGTLAARVKDGNGHEAASHVVAGNGNGRTTVAGSGSTWTLEGETSDANGNAEVRLACV
jgi:hypothetical protein